MLGRAARLASAQGRDGGERGEKACDKVGDGGARAHRACFGRAVGGHETGHGLRDEIEGGAVSIRAGGAVAVDADHDEIRVNFGETLFGQANLVEHAGAVIFGQQVGVLQQPFEHLFARVRAQIERERAFVAVEPGEIPREIVDMRALAADRIACFGRLDLDDVSAQIAQQHGAERPRQNAR